MTRRLIFTVDLDRDVNLPLKGRREAGSIDRGEGDSPRFSSSERGLRLLMDLMDDIGMKATFFVEGRTAESIDCSCISGHGIGLHGYDHEDLTGESTGVQLSEEDIMHVLDRGMSAVSDRISRPTCFRAPYMSANDSVLRCVLRTGIHIDSSTYGTVPHGIGVSEPIPGMREFPVPKGRDEHGRTIAAYLWPMHENKRIPSDYIGLSSQVEDGPFVLATHTWHIVESRKTGPMGPEEIRSNLDNLRSVLTGIIDSGFEPSVMD